MYVSVYMQEHSGSTETPRTCSRGGGGADNDQGGRSCGLAAGATFAVLRVLALPVCATAVPYDSDTGAALYPWHPLNAQLTAAVCLTG